MISRSPRPARRKDMSNRIDAELVDAARAGDRQAFAELVGRYQNVVSALAYALTGDLSRSEELAQDVFLAAWQHLGQLREPDRFRSWLYGITRNLRSRYAPGHAGRSSVDWKEWAAKEGTSEPSILERM